MVRESQELDILVQLAAVTWASGVNANGFHKRHYDVPCMVQALGTFYQM